jgi:hypothetical protein
MVVEELLKFLVSEIDAKLLESVETEDFKTGDIETTDEELSWELSGQSNVTLDSDKVEKFFEDTFGQSSSTVVTLLWGLTFADVLRTDLYSWRAQVFGHVSGVDTEEISGFVGGFSAVQLTLLFSLFLLEDHALEVENSARDLVDTVDDIWSEVQNFERFLGGFQFFTIVQTFDGDLTHTDGRVSIWILDDQASLDKFRFSAGKTLVEDVVVSFTFKLVSDSRFLQKVSLDITGGKFTGWAEVDSNKFTESGRVIVPGGLSVTESFHSRVSGDDLVFKGLFVSFSGAGGGDHGEVLDNFFGVNSFTGTGLTGDQHRLIVSIDQHVLVGGIGDAVQMWWHLGLSLGSVAIDHFLTVHWEHLVWVDGDAEETGVGVDHEHGVSISEIEEDGSLVQVGHIGHIFDFVHLGWIFHLLHHVFFLHLDFLTIAESLNESHTVLDFFQQTLFVKSLGFWYPDELLTLVGFGVGHELVLLVVGHPEVAGGIAELLQKCVAVHVGV